MSFADMTLSNFTEVLASNAPVPGGGGASAAAGSLAASLGCMVGNLTSGKKKYAQYESDICADIAECERLRKKLLELADADAAAFEPLAKAYGIPKDTQGRDAVLSKALSDACTVPLQIMETVSLVIEVLEDLYIKGSRLMLSDVGVGAALAAAAMRGASLNVYVNTKLMADREEAARTELSADELLDGFAPRADEIYRKTVETLRGRD
jgi:formiminotetrahydrofolate cyclodeaminase